MAAPLSYSTHRRLHPLYHFFLLPVALAQVLVAAWSLFEKVVDDAPDRFAGPIWNVVLSLAGFAAVVLIRGYAAKVQDRIIRLEQRLRLERLLPERRGDFDRITMRQWIALRFAGDAEIPSLVAFCLSDPAPSGEAVKRRIAEWTADPARI